MMHLQHNVYAQKKLPAYLAQKASVWSLSIVGPWEDVEVEWSGFIASCQQANSGKPNQFIHMY